MQNIAIYRIISWTPLKAMGERARGAGGCSPLCFGQNVIIGHQKLGFRESGSVDKNVRFL